MVQESPFSDLSRQLRLRATLGEAEPSLEPRAIRIDSADHGRPTRLALLPGSFNPLTQAHAALADLALKSGRVDQVWYLLATRTVDKERIEGASLADRLVCLTEYTRKRPRQGVLLVNRGLYVDQAELVRREMPFLDELWFVVGFDKIIQIFDPRYYRDRNAALDRLFALASFLVSPREPAGPDDLDAFLDEPENRRYRTGIVKLGLSRRYQRLSSTRVREAARQGQPSDEVPGIVRRFIEETGAYAEPILNDEGRRSDRYALREELIDLAERGQLPEMSATEFRHAIEQLVGEDASARRRRAALHRGDVEVALGATTEQIS